MSNQPYRSPTAYGPENHKQKSPGFAKLGIASFVLVMLAGLGMFASIVIAGIIETSTPGGVNEESSAAMMIGLSIFGFLFLALIGFGLGIGSLFQSGNKVFGILGIVFSILVGLCTIGLVIIGLTVEA